MQLKKIIIFLLTLSFIFVRCERDCIVFKQIAIENRIGKKSNEIFKVDTVVVQNDIISYTSVVNNNHIRRYILGETEVRKQSSLKESITLKLIDSKDFYCLNNSYLVHKYLLDISSSSDEESFKYYTSQFGIILETFQKETSIETISVNDKIDKDLSCLIKQIKSDTMF